MDVQTEYHSICLMSRVLKVSRSGYYKWKNIEASNGKNDKLTDEQKKLKR